MTLQEFCEHIAQTHSLSIDSRGGSYTLTDDTRGIRLLVMAEYFDSGKYAGQQRVFVLAQNSGGPRTKTQYYTRIPLGLIKPDNKNINDGVKRLVDIEISTNTMIQRIKASSAKRAEENTQRVAALKNPDTTLEDLVKSLIKECERKNKPWYPDILEEYLPYLKQKLK